MEKEQRQQAVSETEISSVQDRLHAQILREGRCELCLLTFLLVDVSDV